MKRVQIIHDEKSSLHRAVLISWNRHQIQILDLVTFSNVHNRFVFHGGKSMNGSPQVGLHVTGTCHTCESHTTMLLSSKLQQILWLKTWCERDHFETNWTAESSGYFVDTPQAVCCFFCLFLKLVSARGSVWILHIALVLLLHLISCIMSTLHSEVISELA